MKSLMIKVEKNKELNTRTRLIKVSLYPEDPDGTFDQRELQSIFSNFGNIRFINVKPKGVAFIDFSTFLEAFFAVIAMNDWKVPNTDKKLIV